MPERKQPSAEAARAAAAAGHALARSRPSNALSSLPPRTLGWLVHHNGERCEVSLAILDAMLLDAPIRVHFDDEPGRS